MPFCLLSKFSYDPDDQRFCQASRWILRGLTWHFDKIISFCDKWSMLNYIIIYAYIPSMTSVAPYFCYDFTGVLLVDCAVKSEPHAKSFGCGKLTHVFYSLLLYNTTSFHVIIRWNVLFVEKTFLMAFSTGHGSPIDGMQILPKIRCHLQITSYLFELVSVNVPISLKQCYDQVDYSFY